jgi:translation elongation factor EF-Ts
MSIKKKNLKTFNRKIIEKKALEKIGSIKEVSYNWSEFKQDLSKLIIEEKENVTLKTVQVLTLVEDYFKLSSVHSNLQLGFLLANKRNNDIIREIIEKISIVFDNDLKKVVTWFFFINPSFDGASPADFFIVGREKEVLDHVNEKILELVEKNDTN